MPRRSVLTVTEREALLAFPTDVQLRVQHYTLSDADLAVIGQRRGESNRLGFAVQLCALRFPGRAVAADETPDAGLLTAVCEQLGITADCWEGYGVREQTRDEHLVELQALLRMRTFRLEDYRRWVGRLAELAERTDRGIVLAEALIEGLRAENVILPSIEVLERICAEALTRGTRRMHQQLAAALPEACRAGLDQLLEIRDGGNESWLAWARQSPGGPKVSHILAHMERLRVLRRAGVPAAAAKVVHRSRLVKLAREGGQMTSQHLRDFEDERRHATLAAVVLDSQATLIDEIIELHDRYMGRLFSKAKRIHSDRFENSSTAISDAVKLFSKLGRALLEAKDVGGDPFDAVATVIPWDRLGHRINEAEQLLGPANFDHLVHTADSYTQVRRYAPQLLDLIDLKAAPAARDTLTAIELLRDLNGRQARKIPGTAPTSFVRKRWRELVHTPDGIDRRFYELCVLSELRNSLRSGDIWAIGSRQHRDFDEYLVPTPVYTNSRDTGTLGLNAVTDCDEYLTGRLGVLTDKLQTVEALAAAGQLPEAAITPTGRLRISPLTNLVPDTAKAFNRAIYAQIPRVKITDLIREVSSWVPIHDHFTHLKSGRAPEDEVLLLTALLSDALNLGLRKMAEACPGTSISKLGWLQSWHVREETYQAAIAAIVNTQNKHPFATRWGHGETSSSDGQNFKAGGRGLFAGQVNLKYGQEPGVQFYTHVSDQYAPFHSTTISSTIRDSTHVLDGLLHHESDLRIKEHYTDTAGFTDHVFALMHLLGYRFAPRIRGVGDKRLYIPGTPTDYPTLKPLIGATLKTRHIRAHWDEILRLAASIKTGTVTASLMLRKLGSYPRQNGLSVALRELGRLERSIFILDWMADPELRRRVQTGLNKGEAVHALDRAVFLHRLGELRDHSYDNQRHRASGLNLVTAAIVLWNTVYLDHVLTSTDHPTDDPLLEHLSPLSWEHINLTGDYTWHTTRQPKPGKLRALRRPGTR